MIMWSVFGLAAGYTVYKFLPYIQIFKKWQSLPKGLFAICGVMFSYHGYKLMDYTKKKGQR